MSDLAEARREAWQAEMRDTHGIDDTLLKALVDAFYLRVRDDPLLGPVFDAAIDDWTPHLEKMTDFWSGVALMTGRYKGKPLQKHLPLPIDGRHFARWLTLWRATVREACEGGAAEFLIDRAERIAESLQLGISNANRAPMLFQFCAGERT